MKKKTLEDMRLLASGRGGRCLALHYLGSSSPLEWECQKGHQWRSSPSSITQGSWCPYCAGRGRKSYADIVALAASRGGKFLSPEYAGEHEKYGWECAEGHQWFTTPNSIHNGTWCPECSRSRSERCVRLHFERAFNEKFPSSRPKWLTNSRGNRMELDGYCAKLGIAFEYHGMQHFVHKQRYHRHPEALAQRQSDDQRKRDLCEANGVHLVEIPYQVPIDMLHSFLVSQCDRLGIRIPDISLGVEIEIQDIYLRRILDELRNHAVAKGGLCLSTTYKNSLVRLEWECAKGHRWWAIPQSIRRGHWCPTCVRKKRRTLDYMRELASKRGGQCLSMQYTNAKTPLLWKCERGHEWQAVYSSIQKGTWCKMCAGLGKKTIEEMKALARIRGGECLSDHYVGVDFKIRWRCANGHEWFASPWNVKKRNGTWCPRCSGNQKKSLSDMQDLAQLRGGFCRSAVYINARTDLIWECARGHRWSATPDSIQQGSWCRKCPRLTVEAMQKLAYPKGGRCISSDYLGRYISLEWQCSLGHVFSATPNAIRQGGWCVKCMNHRKIKL